MEAFFVSRQGNQEGPHSLHVIENKIKTGYLRRDDYIFDSNRQSWVLLFQYEVTASLFKSMSSKGHPQEGFATKHLQSFWYLLRKETQTGPYEIEELISLIHAKEAFEYDYVWNERLPQWTSVAECEEIQKRLKENQNSPSKMSASLILRRREARVEHRSSLIIHNHKALWNAESFEISPSGASLVLNSNSMKPGQMVVVHYRPAIDVPAFNAHCEVVSTLDVKDDRGQKKVRLGLRFVSVTQGISTVLKKLVDHKAA